MTKSKSTKYRNLGKATQTANKDDYTIDFFRFAPEIRNRIYDIVFVKPTYIGSTDTQFSVRTKAFYKDANSWRNLGFAMTCRQIYEESANIFYAKNGFEFYYTRPSLDFLEAIGVQHRGLLTKLRYHQSENSSPFIVCRYLKSCTSLMDLGISARVALGITEKFVWEYPLKDTTDFSTGTKIKTEFGEPRCLGESSYPTTAPTLHGRAPFQRPHVSGVGLDFDYALFALALNSFAKSLEKVKKEEKGIYKR